MSSVSFILKMLMRLSLGKGNFENSLLKYASDLHFRILFSPAGLVMSAGVLITPRVHFSYVERQNTDSFDVIKTECYTSEEREIAIYTVSLKARRYC